MNLMSIFLLNKMEEIWYGKKNLIPFLEIKDNNTLVWWAMKSIEGCIHGEFLCSIDNLNKGEICSFCDHKRGSRWGIDEIENCITQKGYKVKGKLPNNSNSKFNYKCLCGDNCESTIKTMNKGRNSCKKCMKEQIKHTNLKIYGCEHVMQNLKFKEKMKKTNLEKYGHECSLHNPDIREKTKKTNLQRYGKESQLQNSDVKKKIEITNLKRYGYKNPLSNPEIREKIIKTNLLRYGYKYALSNSKIRDKQEVTNLKRYGFLNPSQNLDVLKRIRKTMMERYGYYFASQNLKVKEKMIKTFIKNYGVTNPLKVPEIREKAKKTMIKRYGKPYPIQNSEIYKKIKKTMMNRYGYIHSMQVLKFFIKQQTSSYKFKKFIFPSGKEVYCQGYENKALNTLLERKYKEEEIEVSLEGRVPVIGYSYTHVYHPDIFIPLENKIIEVKSIYTFGFNCKNFDNISPDNIRMDIYSKNIDKADACVSLGYKFEFWIYKKNGELYIINHN